MSPRARLAFLLLCLAVAAVCARLGLWQRSRLAQRRASNATVVAARSLPPVALGIKSWKVVDQQRVTARGEYDHAHEVVVRHQVVGGVPGVLVATPLLGGSIDSAVLVVRGFVPSGDGVHVPALDSLREPGQHEVSGYAERLGQREDGGRPLERDGAVTWKGLDLPAIRARLPYPVSGVAIRQAPAPGLGSFPRRLEPAAPDDGAHWSYMMQWFGFATVAVVTGLLVFLRRPTAGWSEPTAGPGPGGVSPPAPPA